MKHIDISGMQDDWKEEKIALRAMGDLVIHISIGVVHQPRLFQRCYPMVGVQENAPF